MWKKVYLVRYLNKREIFKKKWLNSVRVQNKYKFSFPNSSLAKPRFPLTANYFLMKVVLQKVKNASVTVDNQLISQINQGYCLLVGIQAGDQTCDLEYMVKKILSIRLFNDNEKQWKNSIVDIKGEILSVSQFTLYATFKGTKPEFRKSMPAPDSRIMYDKFLEMLGKSFNPDLIKDGQFGAFMDVQLTNDGPVTIILESK